MWNKLSKNDVSDLLIQKEVENLNDPITIKNGDWVVKNSFPREKTQVVFQLILDKC